MATRLTTHMPSRRSGAVRGASMRVEFWDTRHLVGVSRSMLRSNMDGVLPTSCGGAPGHEGTGSRGERLVVSCRSDPAVPRLVDRD